MVRLIYNIKIIYMQTNLTKARANAKKIGVTVKPSTVKNKKLDVFKDDKKVPKKTHVEQMLDAMGEGAQEWATNYGKKRSEERKKQTAN